MPTQTVEADMMCKEKEEGKKKTRKEKTQKANNISLALDKVIVHDTSPA